MDEDAQLTNLRQMLRECNGDAAVLATRLRSGFLPTIGGNEKPMFAGRKSLHRYIVAIKHKNHAFWPKEKEKDIQRAQRLYDAGSHEVFQGHDGPWRILYCKARSRPVGPRNYFKSMVAFSVDAA